MAGDGDDVSKPYPEEILCKCGSRVKNGPTCVTCGSSFHPSCAARYRKCCGITLRGDLLSPDVAGSDSSSVIAYLQSPTFSTFIAGLMKTETAALREVIAELQNEVKVLKESNIDMIKLLSSGKFSDPSSNVDMNDICRNCSPTTLSSSDTTKQIGTVFAGKVNDLRIKIPTSNQKIGQQPAVVNKQNESTSNLKNNSTSKKSRTLGSSFAEVTGNHHQSPPVTTAIKSPNQTLTAGGRSRFTTGTGKFSNCAIKAVPRKSFTYVGNLDTTTTTEDIQSYITARFPSKSFTTDSLPKREGAKSIAFKITADVDVQASLLDSATWPEGVRIKRFMFFQMNRNAKADQT